jgi:hypothetical protein
MPESSFQLIYDIHQAGCRAWFLAPIGFLLMILSVVSWRSGRGNTHGVPRWFPIAFFGVFTVIALAVTWGD